MALAAHIRRPQDFFIPAVASSCLPVTGGLAEAKSEGQSFDIISYEAASTQAIGDFASPQKALEFTRGNYGENDLPSKTFVQSSVKGFKIQAPGDAGAQRTFIAQELRVDMESASDRRNPTAFRSLQVVIDGLSVDDYGLKVTVDSDLFSQNDTKEKLCGAYRQSRQFRKRHASRFYPIEGSSNSGCLGWLFGAKNRIPEAGGVIVATLISTVQWEGKPAPGTEIRGNQLIIKDLGSIYFGEIIIEQDFRRVTLLRFHLGCANGGEGAVCEIQSDTHGWPPKP
ncbi:MAG: hypothetical protein WB992_08180 [Bryobacteraceae bacterium]